MKLPLVIVHWVDAAGTTRWTGIENPIHTNDCVTAGWLLRRDKNEVEIALTIAPSLRDKIGTITIPRRWIKEIIFIPNQKLDVA